MLDLLGPSWVDTYPPVTKLWSSHDLIPWYILRGKTHEYPNPDVFRESSSASALLDASKLVIVGTWYGRRIHISKPETKLGWSGSR